MPLSATLQVNVNVTQTNVLDLETPSSALSFPLVSLLTNGAGASQANEKWSDERTLTTGANEDLDLSGTTLQNAFGINIAFLRIKYVLVYSLPTNTTNLTIGAAAANGWIGPFGATTHTITLKPGGYWEVFDPSAAGYAVTAGTGDLLRITNAAGASAIYRIIVIGATT